VGTPGGGKRHDRIEQATAVRAALGRSGTGRVRAVITFVSEVALASGIREALGSRRRFVAVQGCRDVRRDGLVANRACPPIEVDPDDGTVRLDGRVLAAQPVAEVPLSRRYLMG
jgi:urease subunit alpha